MFNHAPADYVCPFCIALAGIEDGRTLTRPSDFVYRDNVVAAWISCHWWAKNPGHVLVVPVRHIENIYDMPRDLGAAVFDLSQRIAVAMKHAYNCDGVSTRQHNEPAGHQDVWHFHQHVFPRWTGDQLYKSDPGKTVVPPEQRAAYAEKLRLILNSW